MFDEIKNEINGFDNLNLKQKKIIQKYFENQRFTSFLSDYHNNKSLKKRYEYDFTDYDKKNDVIVNFKKLNDLRYINHFLERRNKNLPNKGILITNFITQGQLKKVLINKYSYLIGNIIFLVMILFNNLSRLSFIKSFFLFLKNFKTISKGFYSFSTIGNGRLISKAEVFGRFYSCGFKILNYIEFNSLIFLVAQKINNPEYNLDPSFTFLIKLRRVGINNKIFNVYKFRTMRPYSEYLQEYMYENFALKDGGKIKDDFRVSYFGRILRKFWIDELPMILNVLKGEMKIVGVRPLSEHYFSLYTDEAKNKRIKSKPGLIPPFYADLPKTLDEIIDSELKYLNQYEKNPIKTDFKYFFICFYNIIFKGARSS